MDLTNIDAQPSLKSRDDFSQAVISTLQKRAAFICSNPQCRCSTLAPSAEDENKFIYNGVAAHISAAAPGGPRYDISLDSEDRAGISNAIFLCANCATVIDKNNGIDFSTATLKGWREQHEKWIGENLNKRSDDKDGIDIMTQLMENVAAQVRESRYPISELYVIREGDMFGQHEPGEVEGAIRGALGGYLRSIGEREKIMEYFKAQTVAKIWKELLNFHKIDTKFPPLNREFEYQGIMQIKKLKEQSESSNGMGKINF